MKSVKPRDPPAGDDGSRRNPAVELNGEKRSNETYRRMTDPDARLYRKGPSMEAKPCYIGHGLMGNGSGLIVDARLTLGSGHAERLAAQEMI